MRSTSSRRGLRPKPAEAAYNAFFERFQVDPRAAAMFEDMAKNLAVPKAKGMTTTLVTTKPGQGDHREAHDRAISKARTAWRISSPTISANFSAGSTRSCLLRICRTGRLIAPLPFLGLAGRRGAKTLHWPRKSNDQRANLSLDRRPVARPNTQSAISAARPSLDAIDAAFRASQPDSASSKPASRCSSILCMRMTPSIAPFSSRKRISTGWEGCSISNRIWQP